MNDKENTLPTHHPKIKIAKVEKVTGSTQLKAMDEVLNKLYTLSEQEVVNAIKEMVPEYLCSNGKYNGAFKKRAVHKLEPGNDKPAISSGSVGAAKASGDSTGAYMKNQKLLGGEKK